jgi:DNA invertase Pin-like site-specific DNA recombinase
MRFRSTQDSPLGPKKHRKIICRQTQAGWGGCNCDQTEESVATVGYARVSIREGDQILDRQLHALRAAGSERVFDDRGSGAGLDRPGLTACLAYLRCGDVLTVLDLDRLGRRAGELIRLADDLERRGVGLRALNGIFDTTTPAGRAFLQIQAALAEMDRTLIRQRISEGIAAARARGRNGGRPRVMTPEKLRHAQHLMADQSRSIPAIRHELGEMPASTLYHYLHADGSLKAPGRKLLGTPTQADREDPGSPSAAPATGLRRVRGRV